MVDGDALEAGSEEVDRLALFEAIELHAGDGGAPAGRPEGVVEDALDGGGGLVVGIEGERVDQGEGQGAQVVHAEDVVGVGVREEDGVDVGDAFADGLGVEVRAGVDEDGVVCTVVMPRDVDGWAGPAVARVACWRDSGGAHGAGAAERGDAHGCAGAEEGESGVHAGRRAKGKGGTAELPDDAGAEAWSSGCGWLGLGGAGQRLGDVEEGEAELEEGAVDELLLVFGQAGCGLIRDDREHVDALFCAEEVDLWLLAFGSVAAKLHDGGHIDGLDEPLEGHLRELLHAGVGGADGDVEALSGGVEGDAGLLHLLGCGGRGLVGVFFGEVVRGFGLKRGGHGTRSFRDRLRDDAGAGFYGRFSRRDDGANLFGRWVGVGAGLAVEGELAAVGDDEGLILLGHFLLFRCAWGLSYKAARWAFTFPHLRIEMWGTRVLFGARGSCYRGCGAAGVGDGQIAFEGLAADVAQG